MMKQADLTRLPLEAVAAGCRAEAQRRQRQEAGYCFELFRRALEGAEQDAWQSVSAQYHRLILEWVYAVRAPTDAIDEAEDVAYEAIERFWRTLSGRCNPLAGRFPHVGALLKYLQQCVVTTVLDRRRQARRDARRAALASAEASLREGVPGPESEVIEGVDRSALLARVRAWVDANVSDPAEQLVLRLSYTDDLSPAEIAARFPDRFADAADVRQIKERVLRRARRALSGGTDDDRSLSG
jgi:RNA polymerase sigma factor (sigma-70 family)